MKRRNFISKSLIASTTLACSTNVMAKDNIKPFIVKSGVSRFEGFGQTAILKVSGKDTYGEFALFESKNENGPMSGPPLHIHKFQDEVFQIIEGEFLFQVGDQRIRAFAGDIVFGPRNIPHTFFQLSKKAHMIFSYNPAGKMENIAKEMLNLMPHNPAAFAEVCAKNDVPFVGPPMSGN